MAPAVYILSALTSLACALLLWRGYRANHVRLLLWSGLCFLGLTLENVLLIVDLVLLPSINLEAFRNCIAFLSVLLLLVGLIWNQEK